MPNRSGPVQEAVRQARFATRELGRELRLARITSGLTQAQVARRVGTSQAWISRIENGHVAALTLVAAHRLAAAVGMRVFLRAYPGGRRLLDRPQIELLGRLRERVHPSWRWQLEVPVPRPGDLRAADAVLSIPGCTVVVEAITRLADFQAQLRAARVKARDLGANRMVLLVGASTANRHALHEAATVASAALPLTTRRAVAALAEGVDPGADAVIVL